jgi:hypothetical protein
MVTSVQGHLEVVRLLLNYPSARATISHHSLFGMTALWLACCYGRGTVARALLEGGADPTATANDGTTPMAVAKENPDRYETRVSVEGRRQCVVALEVRLQKVNDPLASRLGPWLATLDSCLSSLLGSLSLLSRRGGRALRASHGLSLLEVSPGALALDRVRIR